MCTPWIDPYVGTARQQVGDVANVRNLISHASVASDGANAIVGSIGANCFRAPRAMQLESAWWEPTGADNTATPNTLSYRRVTVLDAGPNGAGTTVLASLDLTASLASNTTRAFSLIATPTVPKGNVIAVQHATVGGAHSDGTVLRAGQFHLNWSPIR